MRAISQAAVQDVIIEKLGDFFRNHRCSKRNVAAGDTLRQRHDVHFYVRVMIDAKPFACASKAAHHLVYDQQHSVLIANLAYAGEEGGGGLHDAAAAAVTFDEDGGAIFGSFHLYDVFDHLSDDQVTLFLRSPIVDRIAIGVRIGQAHNPGDARFVGKAARIATR